MKSSLFSYVRGIIVSGLVCALLAFLFSSCGLFVSGEKTITKEEYKKMVKGSFDTVNDVVKLVPTSVADVKERLKLAMEDAERGLDRVLKIEGPKRTFANTVLECDDTDRRFDIAVTGLALAKMVSTDKSIRDASNAALLQASTFAIDKFLTVDLYNAFKAYADGNAKRENLTDVRKYCLDETMKGFKRAGLHLPADKLAQVKKLQKELADLSLQFGRNISEGEKAVHVSLDGLAGVSPEFISSLKKDEVGKYIISCNVPSFEEIRNHCSNSTTRRDVARGFRNRGYPANKEVLEKIIEKRSSLATLLGFSSYADFDLDNQMAKSVKTAETFIKELEGNVEIKENEEYRCLVKALSEDSSMCPGVVLQDNKFNIWDIYYTQECYRKKHYNLDDREVAKYFPMEKTIAGLFDIYEKFLNLKFKLLKPTGLWHEDVSIIEIRKKGNDFVEGYIFLDLHPREGKFSHACNMGIASSVKARDGKAQVPYVGAVIANFPKSTKNRPSLLKHDDVTTFFHEFGHAMHGLLGRTELSGFAGTNTKHDFVEVPSQMLEEWMWNKEMLKMLSGHYETGEPLPDALIDKMIDLKKFSYGYWVQRQCYLSLLSLAYFKDGAKKDVEKINADLYKSTMKHVNHDPETYNYASFGHLTGYSAKYYCYMWSKFIALDFFDTKCKQGLLNGRVGTELINKVLGKGGEVDAAILVKNFLGREARQDAFLKDIGVGDKKGTKMAEEKIQVLSFFGPPGTGKGTVAQLLVKDFGHTMLSTGDLCRKHIQEGTELGKALQGYIDSGQLVPDDLITQMVLEWLKEKIADGKKIVLDGFPRTKGQANLLLQALGEDPDFSTIDFKTINFDLSEEEIVKRISSRLVCSNKQCQEVYSTLVKPTKEPGVCDVCGSPVIRRSDDEASVVRERLNVFSKFKDELLGYYKEVGKEVINFPIPVGTPEVVFAAFNRLLPSS